MDATGPEYIVAEVSKNWSGLPPQPVTQGECLSGLFERVIKCNRDRGYVLDSWKLNRLMTAPEVMNETIIAVFKRVS